MEPFVESPMTFTRVAPRRDTSSMSELFARGDFPDEFADQLGAAISALRRELVRRTAAAWSAGELSPAQVELLLAVERRPGVSVRELADRLNLAPNTVSTLVRQLTGRGLLVRGKDETDGRVVRLTISPDAQRRFAEWRSARAHVLEEALTQLGSSDRRALASALPALRTLIEQLAASQA